MQFVLLEAAPAGGGIGSILMMVGVVAVFYFLMIRPQKKKEKQTSEMRSNIDVGDGVTTIGGIVGRIVGIKDDTIQIETGSDRTKLRIMRWAVQDVEKLNIEDSSSASASSTPSDTK